MKLIIGNYTGKGESPAITCTEEDSIYIVSGVYRWKEYFTSLASAKRFVRQECATSSTPRFKWINDRDKELEIKLNDK